MQLQLRWYILGLFLEFIKNVVLNYLYVAVTVKAIRQHNDRYSGIGDRTVSNRYVCAGTVAIEMVLIGDF